MALVIFNDGGYSFRNAGGTFDEDKKYGLLFDYIAKDISSLPKLLKQYISKIINITTFELTGHQYDDNDSLEIIQLLKSLHKYYEHECEHRKVLIKAIGDYFNNLLAWAHFNRRDLSLFDYERYDGIFMRLASPFMETKDKYPDKYRKRYYSNYKEMIGAHVSEDIVEVLIEMPPPPQGFSHELKTQKTMYEMLLWILDTDAPKVSELTTHQRVWLYGEVFMMGYKPSETRVKKQLSFAPKNMNCKLDGDEFYKLHTSARKSHVEFPLETLAVLDKVIDYTKKNVLEDWEYESYEYEVDDLYELLYLEVWSMIQANTSIRKCKHCGLYFVVNNPKMAYCDREVVGEGKTCSEIGPNRSFYKNMKSDPLLEMYNRSYKTHHARRRTGKMSPSEFKDWYTNAKNKLEQVRNGELDKSVFEKWLKE